MNDTIWQCWCLPFISYYRGHISWEGILKFLWADIRNTSAGIVNNIIGFYDAILFILLSPLFGRYASYWHTILPADHFPKNASQTCTSCYTHTHHRNSPNWHSQVKKAGKRAQYSYYFPQYLMNRDIGIVIIIPDISAMFLLHDVISCQYHQKMVEILRKTIFRNVVLLNIPVIRIFPAVRFFFIITVVTMMSIDLRHSQDPWPQK
jgi:hypothetical protein